MSDRDSPDDVFDGVSYGSLSAVFWGLVIFAGLAIGGLDYGEVLLNAFSSPGFPIDIIDNFKVTVLLLEAVGGGGTVAVIGYVIWRYAAPNRSAPTMLRPGQGKYTVTIWTIGVFLLMLMTIFMGAATLAQTDEAANPVQNVNTTRQLNMDVVGAQWSWRMQVEGVPQIQSQRVVVPSNTLITFGVTSADVIHSFAIQTIGIKKDAIPGQTNHASFMVDGVKPHESGVAGDELTTISVNGTQLDAVGYQINCAELCGKGHSKMVATMYVVSPQDYRIWASAHNGTVPDSFTTGGE